MVELGKMLAEGKQPTDGMDFPRLGKVQVEMDTHTIRANTLLDINKDTVDELAKQI
jgi:simple sugar transport system substrate-binding protein